MEPIRPIGPRELDVEPVVHVPRSSRDGSRERPDGREPERREPRQPPAEEPPSGPPDEGTSLIDIRV
jgi:hypothetical protein